MDPIVPLEPLDRGQINVLRVRGIVVALILLAAGGGGEIWLAIAGWWPGLASVPMALIAVWLVFVSPVRKWRHWGYAFTGDELHVAHGWLVKIHTIVPVVRVQHLDVTRGPVERAFGVATLVLHTAGTESSEVHLPGISPDRAAEIRDSIRAGIATPRR